jgi:hypothetical protein
VEFEKTATCLAIEIGCGDRNDRIEAIEMALRAAATVPSGMVRVGTEDMTLLGTLPVTKDRCVAIPMDAVVYHPDFDDAGDVEVNHNSGSRAFGQFTKQMPDGSVEWTEHDVSDCYSTPAAAQAARERGGENG